MGCSFIVSSPTQEDRRKRSFYHKRRRAEKKSEGKCWVVSVKPVRTRRTAHCCWSVVLCPILLPFIYRRLFSRAFLLDEHYQGYGDRFDSVYKGTKFLRPASLAVASQYILLQSSPTLTENLQENELHSHYGNNLPNVQFLLANINFNFITDVLHCVPFNGRSHRRQPNPDRQWRR